jgi:hypothetical protein
VLFGLICGYLALDPFFSLLLSAISFQLSAKTAASGVFSGSG